MILTTIAAVLMLQGPSLVCPIMLEEVDKDAKMMDYNGVRYAICCDTCETKFAKDPTKVLSNKKIEGHLVGFSLFDPISGERIDQEDSKAFSDFKSVRYYFATPEGKTAFDAKPETFAAAPKKEALFCAVMGHAVDNYDTAGGYVTLGETRYYVCCGGCVAKMKKEGDKLAPSAKDHVKDPSAILVKKAEGHEGH
jgi:YHS domain-containing protein